MTVSTTLPLHERRLRERREARLARPKAKSRKGRGTFELASAAGVAGILVLLLLAGASVMAVAGIGGWRGTGGIFGGGAGGNGVGGSGGNGGSADNPIPSGTFRVGSILLVPWSGKICEERLFDNFTGRLVSDAIVDCEARLLRDGILALVPEDASDKKERTRNVVGVFKR